METIHERILHIATTEGISISQMERDIKVGGNSLSTSLRRKSAIPHYVIQSIALRYPKFSLSWLVLGTEESPKELKLNHLLSAVEDIKRGLKQVY